MQLPTGIDSIRPATPADRTAVVDLVNFVFGSQTADRFWHMYSPELLQPDAWWLAIAKSKIVGAVAAYPCQYRSSEFSIPFAAVTGVATLPEWRGRGIMTTLLQATISRIDQQGFPFSILQGDRLRYGRYGWEKAGRRGALTLTQRFFPAPSWTPHQVEEVTGAGSATKLPAGFCDRLLAIQRRYCGWEFRSIAGQGGICGRMGVHTLLVEDGDRQAYAMVGDSDAIYVERSLPTSSTPEALSKLYELVGDPELAADLCGYILQRSRTALGTLAALPTNSSNPVERILWERAAHLVLTPTGMVRVNDLVELLRPFRNWWKKRPRSSAGSVALKISGEQTGALLTWDETEVDVQPMPADPTCPIVVGSRAALAAAVFGPLDPANALPDQPHAALLNELFPLPLDIPRLEQM